MALALWDLLPPGKSWADATEEEARESFLAWPHEQAPMADTRRGWAGLTEKRIPARNISEAAD